MFNDDMRAGHVFAVPPGADFPKCLADGLARRLNPLSPEARARVTVLVNSARMRTTLRAALLGQGPGLLPRIKLVTEPLVFEGATVMPPPVSPLRRRLELAQLIEQLLRASPDLAPRSAIYDLADSLARLFAEMQAEGVSLEVLQSLDVSRHSGHWARSLAFIALAERVFRADAPDPEGRQRAQAEALIAQWNEHPPPDPVIIAGSTGSRGTTALLMQAVARLPQGAVVLPGFDFDMPADTWSALDDGLAPEDHPQYRFLRILKALGMSPEDVVSWDGSAAPVPARGALVSLASRPGNGSMDARRPIVARHRRRLLGDDTDRSALSPYGSDGDCSSASNCCRNGPACRAYHARSRGDAARYGSTGLLADHAR